MTATRFSVSARFAAVLCLASLGCSSATTGPATDDRSGEVAEPLTPAASALTPYSILYPNLGGAGGYWVKSLEGSLICDTGSVAAACYTNVVDLSQMTSLTSAQVQTVMQRIQSADSNIADASVLLQGNLFAKIIRDHRTNTTYKAVYFQALNGYFADTPRVHSSQFFFVWGSTQQFGQLMAPNQLGFAAKVTFPFPVLTNSYGVVADAVVSGSVDWTVNPVHITADQFFRRL
jgi:hypothetical protein